ncbi:hypothetical protein COL26b_013816 [Colletotrichum chrysophilum]|uniref:uncharacterized protein n=1 Tax=Colletotrichum chrysophilum TaxID=1836956 RepID=UPI002301E5D8|nr:uncharacterized protein COL26b_013816 [Colletotrichum chrysophilum]KAJ0361131.1 hypothetical protein COL26b_013816 [Colletotrichum chrysophilum]
MAPIKVGIVGCRYSAQVFHLPYILPNPDFDIYAVLQRTPVPKAGEAPPPFGHCTIDFPRAKHHATANSFFADSNIDLVVVCTRVHEDFVEASIKAGKHVVVEKPFVPTSAIADRLIQLATEKNKILTVFHNRRFDNDFLTLQHLINEGALGEVKEAELHFDVNAASWVANWNRKKYTPGEGITFGLGTHTIDQALLLFGPPKSVTGFLRSNRGIDSDIDDTFTIILQYGGERRDLLVTIKTGIITHMQDQLKYFVRGTKGTYLKFGTDPQESQAAAAPGKPARADSFGVEPERLWGTLSTETEFDSKVQKYDNSSKMYIGRYPTIRGRYRGYYEKVADAILGRSGGVYVKPETARDGLRIIELVCVFHTKGAAVPFS